MSAENAVKNYIREAVTSVDNINVNSVVEITEVFSRCLSSGGKILLCGNGGSASDASHFAGELVGRFRTERTAMAAVALTTEMAVITALANDYGYERVFSRQVEAIGRKGDILVAISTSGTSSNVVSAAETAKQRGLSVVAFTSKLGKKLEWADFHWESGSTETSFTQEQMLVAFHAICFGLEEVLVGKE